MARAQSSAAFVGDHVEEAVHDHPADHTVDGYCRQCKHTGELKCPRCKSSDLQVDGPVQGGRRAFDGEKLRWLLLTAQSHANPRYFLGCFFIAIGDPAAMGETMSQFGEKWKVTRQAVSKTVNLIRITLGLAPSAYMKSEESRTAFRKSNWRPRKLK